MRFINATSAERINQRHYQKFDARFSSEIALASVYTYIPTPSARVPLIYTASAAASSAIPPPKDQPREKATAAAAAAAHKETRRWSRQIAKSRKTRGRAQERGSR